MLERAKYHVESLEAFWTSKGKQQKKNQKYSSTLQEENY